MGDGHPGVTVISRDRGGAYAKGARDGAPEAVQVADRFHLLQNLAETLEMVFTKHAKDLCAAEQGRQDAGAAENGTVPVPPSVPQTSVQALAAGRRERRITTHEQVWRLKGEGWTAEAIARHLGISRASVFRNLRHEVFPERERRRPTLDVACLTRGRRPCSGTGTVAAGTAVGCSARCGSRVTRAAMPRSPVSPPPAARARRRAGA